MARTSEVAIQCFDGDGVKRRFETLHVECEHFGYTGTRITETRSRGHAIAKLFGDVEVAHLREAMREPLLWVEFRYLKGTRSISYRFHDVTISRMKKKFNGWNVFLHYSKVAYHDVHHG